MVIFKIRFHVLFILSPPEIYLSFPPKGSFRAKKVLFSHLPSNNIINEPHIFPTFSPFYSISEQKELRGRPEDEMFSVRSNPDKTDINYDSFEMGTGNGGVRIKETSY
jgi:hypothetical protein